MNIQAAKFQNILEVFCYDHFAVRLQLVSDDDTIRTAVLQSSNAEHPIWKVIEFDDIDLV